ncbi:hypothetical protein [Rhizobium chutanense]|nr:hypothetical protein [Rhizobium chutanense]
MFHTDKATTDDSKQKHVDHDGRQDRRWYWLNPDPEFWYRKSFY